MDCKACNWHWGKAHFSWIYLITNQSGVGLLIMIYINMFFMQEDRIRVFVILSRLLRKFLQEKIMNETLIMVVSINNDAGIYHTKRWIDSSLGLPSKFILEQFCCFCFLTRHFQRAMRETTLVADGQRPFSFCFIRSLCSPAGLPYLVSLTPRFQEGGGSSLFVIALRHKTTSFI